MFMITPLSDDLNFEFTIGILNSRLLRKYWTDNFYDLRHTFPKIKGTYLAQLPIRLIDPTSPSDVHLHDDVIALVERMLALHRRMAVEKSAHDRTVVERQIEATDREIDRAVYGLYGLTAAEVAVVEEE
jgi:hypothetical protein